jgi:hypothetical protein
MVQIARGFGRRRSPRLRLGMPARLITPERSCPIVLENLTVDGAGVTLPEPSEFMVCVLRWMDNHAFADVVWREGFSVGLQFDKPIPAETLEATRLYANQHWGPELALRRC